MYPDHIGFGNVIFSKKKNYIKSEHFSWGLNLPNPPSIMDDCHSWAPVGGGQEWALAHPSTPLAIQIWRPPKDNLINAYKMKHENGAPI